MTFTPSQKYLILLRLRLFLIAIIVASGLGILYFYSQIPTLVWSVGIFVPLVFIWAVYLPLVCKSHKAVTEKSALCVYKGLIIKRKHVSPYCRPIYCKFCSGPIQRIFGLCTVKIRLVGGDLNIDGLSRKDGLLLIEKLESKYDK